MTLYDEAWKRDGRYSLIWMRAAERNLGEFGAKASEALKAGNTSEARRYLLWADTYISMWVDYQAEAIAYSSRPKS